MDITPILRRELLTATRKPRLWGNRSFFAAILLTAILATVGAGITGTTRPLRIT